MSLMHQKPYWSRPFIKQAGLNLCTFYINNYYQTDKRTKVHKMRSNKNKEEFKG